MSLNCRPPVLPVPIALPATCRSRLPAKQLTVAHTRTRPSAGAPDQPVPAPASRKEDRGLLQHQAVQRRLIGAVVLVEDRGAIRRRRGLLQRGLHALLISRLWCFTVSRPSGVPPWPLGAPAAGRLPRGVNDACCPQRGLRRRMGRRHSPLKPSANVDSATPGDASIADIP